jgi:hypothetical protein
MMPMQTSTTPPSLDLPSLSPIPLTPPGLTPLAVKIKEEPKIEEDAYQEDAYQAITISAGNHGHAQIFRLINSYGVSISPTTQLHLVMKSEPNIPYIKTENLPTVIPTGPVAPLYHPPLAKIAILADLRTFCLDAYQFLENAGLRTKPDEIPLMEPRQKTKWIVMLIKYFDGVAWPRLQIGMVVSHVFGKGERTLSQYKSKVTKVLGAVRQQSKKRKIRDISPPSSQNMNEDEETDVPMERPKKKSRPARDESIVEV